MSNISVRNNNLSKGKEPLHTYYNAEKEWTKSKAISDHRTTTNMFFRPSRKGECNERTLTKIGWRDVIAQFNSSSDQKNHDKGQFKNKWNNLRKDWCAWHNLFQHETRIGFDYDTNNLRADTEWWDAKEKVGTHYDMQLLYKFNKVLILDMTL